MNYKLLTPKLDIDIRDLSPQDKKLFALLANSAHNAERCPTNDQIANLGFKQRAVADLAHRGYITVRLYNNNERQVIINIGPHKGSSTVVSASCKKPTKVSDYDPAYGKTYTAPSSLEIPDWAKV